MQHSDENFLSRKRAIMCQNRDDMVLMIEALSWFRPDSGVLWHYGDHVASKQWLFHSYCPCLPMAWWCLSPGHQQVGQWPWFLPIRFLTNERRWCIYNTFSDWLSSLQGVPQGNGLYVIELSSNRLFVVILHINVLLSSITTKMYYFLYICL